MRKQPGSKGVIDKSVKGPDKFCVKIRKTEFFWAKNDAVKRNCFNFVLK